MTSSAARVLVLAALSLICTALPSVASERDGSDRGRPDRVESTDDDHDRAAGERPASSDDGTVDLGPSGTDQTGNCPGDYFKVDSAETMLLEGTHTYTGTTQAGSPWTATLDVTLDEDGEVDTIEIVSADSDAVFYKTGDGTFRADGDLLDGAKAISNVTFCVDTGDSSDGQPEEAGDDGDEAERRESEGRTADHAGTRPAGEDGRTDTRQDHRSPRSSARRDLERSAERNPLLRSLDGLAPRAALRLLAIMNGQPEANLRDGSPLAAMLHGIVALLEEEGLTLAAPAPSGVAAASPGTGDAAQSAEDGDAVIGDVATDQAATSDEQSGGEDVLAAGTSDDGMSADEVLATAGGAVLLLGSLALLTLGAGSLLVKRTTRY